MNAGLETGVLLLMVNLPVEAIPLKINTLTWLEEHL
jgi:hypothetical protein